MLLQIPDVLDTEQVARARQLLDDAVWLDDRAIAGRQSPRVGEFLRLHDDDPVSRQIGSMVLEALQRNPLFVSAALPLRVFPPLFARYQGGHWLGNHVDDAIRRLPGPPFHFRTDLSATLFFADPDEYVGGELVVEDADAVHSVKLPSGHMVLYPATSPHLVRPVTRGARVASFFWVQSLLRDNGDRRLLFDLDTAIQRLTLDIPDHPAAAQLSAVYHNLLRRWAEP